MSRYLILVLLNLPLILIALLGAIVDYKTGKITKKKYWAYTAVWVIILLCLTFAHSIYEFLFSNKLTVSEPLSLFDVIQITGIIFILFVANRSRIKIEILEKRIQDLHQELSIRLSEQNKNKSRK